MIQQVPVRTGVSRAYPGRPGGVARATAWSKVAALSVCLLTIAWAPVEHAQTISLAPAQRERLAQLVVANAGAGRLFKKIRREADAVTGEAGHPVERLATAGVLESDPAKIKSRVALEDVKQVQALGYAYAVTLQSRYAEDAKQIILSWARTNQPTGSPIDETKLEPLFVSYDFTRATFSVAERGEVEAWLRQIAEKEQASGRKKSVTASNNWQSHRLKILGLIGFLLEDQQLIQETVEGYKKQVEVDLRPDGSSFDFHERDALHYHCYTLEPLLALAIAAQRNGIDLYHYQSPSGASLPKSVQFLEPYARGEKTHAEWTHSKVAFDRTRAQAGEAKFTPGMPFDPRGARKVFELASYFDRNYASLVQELAASKSSDYATWQMVLNEVSR